MGNPFKLDISYLYTVPGGGDEEGRTYLFDKEAYKPPSKALRMIDNSPMERGSLDRISYLGDDLPNTKRIGFRGKWTQSSSWDGQLGLQETDAVELGWIYFEDKDGRRAMIFFHVIGDATKRHSLLEQLYGELDSFISVDYTFFTQNDESNGAFSFRFSEYSEEEYPGKGLTYGVRYWELNFLTWQENYSPTNHHPYFGFDIYSLNFLDD